MFVAERSKLYLRERENGWMARTEFLLVSRKVFFLSILGFHQSCDQN